jgi:hypothetical protein
VYIALKIARPEAAVVRPSRFRVVAADGHGVDLDRASRFVELVRRAREVTFGAARVMRMTELT